MPRNYSAAVKHQNTDSYVFSTLESTGDIICNPRISLSTRKRRKFWPPGSLLSTHATLEVLKYDRCFWKADNFQLWNWLCLWMQGCFSFSSKFPCNLLGYFFVHDFVCEYNLPLRKWHQSHSNDVFKVTYIAMTSILNDVCGVPVWPAVWRLGEAKSVSAKNGFSSFLSLLLGFQSENSLGI